VVSKENIFLVGVVLLGLTGLAVLQFGRKTPVRSGEDRVMVQAQQKEGAADMQTAAPIQRITGRLVRTQGKYHPEEDKPFSIRLEKFSPGAVYEIQFADGSRKAFNNEGYVQHTFRRSGSNMIRLYARYEGQEIVLDSADYIVTAPKPKEERAGRAMDF
jgi:hypothetical protein